MFGENKPDSLLERERFKKFIGTENGKELFQRVQHEMQDAYVSGDELKHIRFQQSVDELFANAAKANCLGLVAMTIHFLELRYLLPQEVGV